MRHCVANPCDVRGFNKGTLVYEYNVVHVYKISQIEMSVSFLCPLLIAPKVKEPYNFISIITHCVSYRCLENINIYK